MIPISPKKKASFLEKPKHRNASLWIALLLVIITAFLMVAIYTRFLMLHILIEQFYIHHWLSWTGTLFIAIFTPIYYIVKRRSPAKIKTFLNVHMFGNLTAVMFVSIHFTQEITRPPRAYPNLGTGTVLYASMILLVLTGFMLRFQVAKAYRRVWRYVHTSVTMAFYLIIVVHVLHGLAII